jgi:hypothetical protein
MEGFFIFDFIKGPWLNDRQQVDIIQPAVRATPTNSSTTTSSSVIVTWVVTKAAKNGYLGQKAERQGFEPWIRLRG